MIVWLRIGNATNRVLLQWLTFEFGFMADEDIKLEAERKHTERQS